MQHEVVGMHCLLSPNQDVKPKKINPLSPDWFSFNVFFYTVTCLTSDVSYAFTRKIEDLKVS